MGEASKLSRWGNGQGIRLSKSLCDSLGVVVGDPVDIKPYRDRALVISFPQNRYQRRKQVKIDELFDGFIGCAQSTDPWGSDVGAEVIE